MGVLLICEARAQLFSKEGLQNIDLLGIEDNLDCPPDLLANVAIDKRREAVWCCLGKQTCPMVVVPKALIFGEVAEIPPNLGYSPHDPLFW